jgi:hypothetical protein
MFLAGSASDLGQKLHGRISSQNWWTVFNPSFANVGHNFAVSFRAGRHRADKPFRGILLLPEFGQDEWIDLSAEWFGGAVPVADPKLFTMGTEIWLTFNTGHFENPNRVFIAPVWPRFGEPQEVFLEGRRAIEKNWAFFKQGEKLFALYSVEPLVLLREERSLPNGSFQMVSLGRREHSKVNDDFIVGLRRSIGTAIIPEVGEPGSYLGISHLKLYLRNYRTYVGQVFRCRLSPAGASLELARPMLFHSAEALLGNRPRHNPHLISGTYFSGLGQVEQGTLDIAYGINDHSYGFAHADLTKFRFKASRTSLIGGLD